MASYDPNYMSMGGYGLGQGTYGMSPLTAAPEMFSQRALPTDWTQAAITGNVPNMPTTAMPSVAVPGAGSGSGSGSDPGFLNGIIGTKEAPGWGGLALSAGSALFNGFMGMQQYGLAKKTLAENQRQFNLNYDAQRTTTNSALEDRQRARVASNSGAYESVGSYMDRNGVK